MSWHRMCDVWKIQQQICTAQSFSECPLYFSNYVFSSSILSPAILHCEPALCQMHAETWCFSYGSSVLLQLINQSIVQPGSGFQNCKFWPVFVLLKLSSTETVALDTHSVEHTKSCCRAGRVTLPFPKIICRKYEIIVQVWRSWKVFSTMPIKSELCDLFSLRLWTEIILVPSRNEITSIGIKTSLYSWCVNFCFW